MTELWLIQSCSVMIEFKMAAVFWIQDLNGSSSIRGCFISYL